MDGAAANIRGIAHGNIIALSEDLGLPDGQEVDVSVRARSSQNRLAPGEGLKQSFGAWADEGPQFDEYIRTCRHENPSERQA